MLFFNGLLLIPFLILKSDLKVGLTHARRSGVPKAQAKAWGGEIPSKNKETTFGAP
jgi:hypothetical protein